MAKPVHHEIVIVGDGLTGLTMALALAQKNIACAVMGPHLHSPAKKSVADGRTTAIMQDGIAFLDDLGVWPLLEKETAPLKKMRLISGEHEIVFAAREIKREQFGFNIPNGILKDTLLGAVKKSKWITLIDGLAEDIIFPTGKASVVKLTGSTQVIEAALVIAADGANSNARTAAGIATVTTDNNQDALVCLVKAEHTHDWTSTEWYYSGGPFTLVPTKDPQIIAVVYCDTPEIIAEVKDYDSDDLGTLFDNLSNSCFGTLNVISAVQSWPIRPMQAKQIIAPHLALIGEAAHVMPPLAAQGFNTSLRDIQALQDTIYKANALGLDKTAVSNLQSYAGQRDLDIRMRGMAVNGLNALIRRDDTYGRRIHAFGFAALDKIGPLKTAFMRAALAPRGKGRVA
jgi:2-octaprenyl-6-methoxyphenol hydroxylase